MNDISPKSPPHSIEAERSLLGSMLIDAESLEHVMDVIQPDSFYHKAHSIVYQAILDLAKANKPYDVLMVKAQLEQSQQLEKIGSTTYLFDLANQTTSAVHIKSYAQLVRDRYLLRQLIQFAQKTTESAYNIGNKPVVDLLDESERELFRLGQMQDKNDDPVKIDEIIPKVAEKLDALSAMSGTISGTPTGYKDLDQMTAGLQKADLVIVAGRPSMGKTAFAMNIAENISMNSKKAVVVFSLEMPADALVMRLLASLARVDQGKLRTGDICDEGWTKLTSAMGMLSESSLFIDDTPGITPSQMRAKIRRIVRSHGDVGLIVVDYLQLMRIPELRDNRTLEISEISRMLKTIAKEFETPVIALSQLNRSLEQRQDKRPIMSDLRESGAIEQDADLIAFIYRDEVYNEASDAKGLAEIIIGKQRNGPIGKVVLTFLGRYTRFENHARDEELLSLVDG
ncbi:replicative DNA helicase [Candidatus Synchoanobacter obligatus]|uniref:Replicative DNA helicase n=1 Tax=Candidatus Synchoanobacter obligatus TaxID=2919597 RepID=A0ABT1L449_9GAMM|nr:replicative DNA helicase [Candidatus Synchoanobacter obligatus]MCP8351941.1 replicative DNA helicase [Candidatus Synchoanobacter obligatus]